MAQCAHMSICMHMYDFVCTCACETELCYCLSSFIFFFFSHALRYCDQFNKNEIFVLKSSKISTNAECDSE